MLSSNILRRPRKNAKIYQFHMTLLSKFKKIGEIFSNCCSSLPQRRTPLYWRQTSNDKNLLQLNAYKGFNWTHFRISLHIFDNVRTSDVPWITLILCSAPYCMVSFLQWGANFIIYVQRNPEVSSIKSFVGIQLKWNWWNACNLGLPAIRGCMSKIKHCVL